jgi:hypothetical protein
MAATKMMTGMVTEARATRCDSLAWLVSTTKRVATIVKWASPKGGRARAAQR